MITDRNLREPAALDLRLRILERLVGEVLGRDCLPELREAFSEAFPRCSWPDDERLRAEFLHHLERHYSPE